MNETDTSDGTEILSLPTSKSRSVSRSASRDFNQSRTAHRSLSKDLSVSRSSSKDILVPRSSREGSNRSRGEVLTDEVPERDGSSKSPFNPPPGQPIPDIPQVAGQSRQPGRLLPPEDRSLGRKSREQPTLQADTLFIRSVDSAVDVRGGVQSSNDSDIIIKQSKKETTITLESRKENHQKKKTKSSKDNITKSGKDWSQVMAKEKENYDEEFVPKFPEILCRGNEFMFYIYFFYEIFE